MNYPDGPEGYRNDRRQSSGTHPLVTLALAETRRVLSAHKPWNLAIDALAENPATLCLTGRLISRAAAGNDVRFEKVAVLRQAIEAGAYNVSSADLAEKLMDSLRR